MVGRQLELLPGCFTSHGKYWFPSDRVSASMSGLPRAIQSGFIQSFCLHISKSPQRQMRKCHAESGTFSGQKAGGAGHDFGSDGGVACGFAVPGFLRTHVIVGLPNLCASYVSFCSPFLTFARDEVICQSQRPICSYSNKQDMIENVQRG